MMVGSTSWAVATTGVAHSLATKLRWSPYETDQETNNAGDNSTSTKAGAGEALEEKLFFAGNGQQSTEWSRPSLKERANRRVSDNLLGGMLKIDVIS